MPEIIVEIFLYCLPKCLIYVLTIKIKMQKDTKITWLNKNYYKYKMQRNGSNKMGQQPTGWIFFTNFWAKISKIFANVNRTTPFWIANKFKLSRCVFKFNSEHKKSNHV